MDCKPLTVGWFSCGCSSLVACSLVSTDKVIYIHVSNQHPDTLRFLSDARCHFSCEIEVLQSTKYLSVDDVISHTGYINGPSGARCTLELKKRVRQKWESEHWARHTYVWGFDCNEVSRAERVREYMPEFNHSFPLIEHGLNKSDCHALCEDWGIKRPLMYELGYPNNNCIGCVKGGKGYWNMIRSDFPDVFKRRSIQERSIGHSCIKGCYLDELPLDAGISDPVIPNCSIDCYALTSLEVQ